MMKSKKKFAVVLSGSGVYDGSEIHEASLLLYAISKNGGEYEIFAPNVDQHHVMNHISGEEMQEKRNVLIESARIARGKIEDLKTFRAENFDAILFPGGFGVAKNLCKFAFKGTHCHVNEDVEAAVKAMHKAGKPIGALCIAPVLIAKILGKGELTIGNDPETAKAIESLGANHVNSEHGEIVTDLQNKIVSSPCYMLDATILQIAEETDKLVKAVLAL